MSTTLGIVYATKIEKEKKEMGFDKSYLCVFIKLSDPLNKLISVLSDLINDNIKQHQNNNSNIICRLQRRNFLEAASKIVEFLSNKNFIFLWRIQHFTCHSRSDEILFIFEEHFLPLRFDFACVLVVHRTICS